MPAAWQLQQGTQDSDHRSHAPSKVINRYCKGAGKKLPRRLKQPMPGRRNGAEPKQS